MSSSTSGFRQFHGLIGVGIAMLLAACVILSGELRYRRAHGGPVGIVPGLTMEEFQWNLKKANKTHVVLVVGDSRTGLGFSEGEFNNQLRRNGYEQWRSVNASLAATSVPDILKYIGANCSGPGIVVVNYSPAAFYFWGQPLKSSPLASLKLQDVLDKKIEMHLRGIFYTKYLRRRTALSLLWSWRTAKYENAVVCMGRQSLSEGLMRATLGNTDGSPLALAEYQLTNYARRMQSLNQSPHAYENGLERFLAAVRAVQAKGYKVLLVRFPVGERMRVLESSIRLGYQLPGVARAVGLPYIDYNTREDTARMETEDESHLTLDSARRMSVVLAQDVMEQFLQGS